MKKEQNNSSNNQSNINLLVKGIFAFIIPIAGGYGAFKYYRKKRQEDLQKRVDESAPKSTQMEEIEQKDFIQIIAIQDDYIDLTKFEKSLINEDEVKKWKAILSLGGEAIKGCLNISTFNGLLKCDVPIKDLCRIKDKQGAMRGFIMKNGKISKHATFTEVELYDVAPLMIYQCLAAITSQYYQHIITEKLSEINSKLDLIFKIIAADDQSKLKTAYNRLIELNSKKTYDIIDKQIVSELTRDVEIIKEKYKKLALDIKTENLRICDKCINKQEAITKIKTFKESHYFEYLEMAMEAEMLIYTTSVVSIKIAQYLNNKEDIEIYKKRINLDFWDNYAEHFKKIKHDVINYLEEESSSSLISKDTINNMKVDMMVEFNSVESSMMRLQNQLNYKTTMYIEFKKDGTIDKYIAIEKDLNSL